MLVEKYDGEITRTVEELEELPGVGRKTANVITSVVWNQPNMPVDTHVFRVSARLGLRAEFFVLAAALNPCPCGFFNDARKASRQ